MIFDKKLASIFLVCVAFSGSFAQDTITRGKVREIEPVTIYGKKKNQFEKIGLYDGSEKKIKKSIRDFTSLEIFNDRNSDEVWVTQNKACIAINFTDSLPASGNLGLHLKWDKIKGGCNWIGLGFGWDYWDAKDISSIVDTAAIQFSVRSRKGVLTNLPLAFCLEDYSDKQAWVGFTKPFLVSETITSEWTKVVIPLSLFPFEEMDFDLASVKQFLIQFEGAGNIDIDNIEFIPFSGKERKSATAMKQNSSVVINGKIDVNEWQNVPKNTISPGNTFAVQYSKDQLVFLFQLSDSTPFVNEASNENTWDGDAIEIAFGANHLANKKRKFYLLSDLQYGLKLGAQPVVWNFKTQTVVANAQLSVQQTPTGLIVECALPISVANLSLLSGQIHGFEVAIDQSGSNKKRVNQVRWNSSSSEGFHLNPSLWGELELVP
jgi:hypothetical protein|uniref:sugar-binding protein n=1 Tax=Fluviicola sp. TaxID=1917219 RepID=UPI00404AE58D